MGGVLQKNKKSKFLEHTCQSHERSVNCCAVDKSGELILTGSDDLKAIVWSVSTGEPKRILEGHKGYICCCDFWFSKKKQETLAVTASADRTIKIWRISDGVCQLSLDHHSHVMTKITINNDLIFSSSYDKTVAMANLRTGSLIRKFEGHQHSVTCFNLLFDDPAETAEKNFLTTETCGDSRDFLITGSSDWTARIWAIKSGGTVYLRTFQGHNGPIICMALDVASRSLFTGSSDHSIKKWDISSGEFIQSMKGHSSSVTQIALKNKILLSTSADWSVRVWSADYGDFIKTFENGHEHMVSSMKISDGVVVTGDGNGVIKVFDPRALHAKATLTGHKYAVNCLCVFPGGKIISGSYDSSVRIWDIKSVLEKLDPVEVEDPKFAFDEDEEYNYNSKRNSLRTPSPQFDYDTDEDEFLRVQNEKEQIRRRSQVDDMLQSSVRQIVEYNLIDEIADTVLDQIKKKDSTKKKVEVMPELLE